MNLTFAITSSFEKEFTTNNLVNSNLRIERVSIVSDPINLGTCLMLDTINNMQERKQSPMVCVNKTYQSDHFNTVIPKTRKWRFYMTNKVGQRVSLKIPMIVSIHFSVDNTL